jgi:hypothetical protein
MACLVGYLVRQVDKATPHGMSEITTGSSHLRLPTKVAFQKHHMHATNESFSSVITNILLLSTSHAVGIA